MQVWLATADLRRLAHAAVTTGKTQSEIAREAILEVLKRLEHGDKVENQQDKLFDGYSDSAKDIIFLAKQEAKISREELVASAHLLLALSLHPDLDTLLGKFAITHLQLKTILSRYPKLLTLYAEVECEPYSPRVVRIIERARVIAKRMLDKTVQPLHLLLSVLDQGNGSAFELLEYMGIKIHDVRTAVMADLPRLRKQNSKLSSEKQR